MRVKTSSNKQSRIKSYKKQTARKAVIRSVPIRNTLKKFAPLSIKIRSSSKQKWKKIALEGKFEVKRTFKEGPDDVFDPYYHFNTEKHHVWTNHLVIGSGTYLDEMKHVASFIELDSSKKFNHDCLDDPENHFYVINGYLSFPFTKRMFFA